MEAQDPSVSLAHQPGPSRACFLCSLSLLEGGHIDWLFLGALGTRKGSGLWAGPETRVKGGLPQLSPHFHSLHSLGPQSLIVCVCMKSLGTLLWGSAGIESVAPSPGDQL